MVTMLTNCRNALSGSRMWTNVLAALTLALSAFGCGGGSTLAVALHATFQEFDVPVQSNLPGATPAGSWPDDLAGDSLGNIWFAQHHSNEIGRMSPTGQYTGFPVPTQLSLMDSIAVDTVNGVVWASESDGNNIARLDMATGVVTEIPYIRLDAS